MESDDEAVGLYGVATGGEAPGLYGIVYESDSESDSSDSARSGAEPE